jgi:hypothetical protein
LIKIKQYSFTRHMIHNINIVYHACQFPVACPIPNESTVTQLQLVCAKNIK